VVKSVQDGVRHHAAWLVEAMPLALHLHRATPARNGKAGSQRSVWSAAIVMMRFSASSRPRRANRDRITSSSWVKNATVGRFITTRSCARHSRIRFSGGTPVMKR